MEPVVQFENVTKGYGQAVAVDRSGSAHRGWQIRHAPRAVRLRQVDDAAHAWRLRNAEFGTHPARLERTSRACRPTSATSTSCFRTMRCSRI